MAEIKKKTSLAVTISVIAALGVGLLAIIAFPGSAPGEVVGPKALLGYLFTEQVSCTLSTGSCNMTILNNSTVPLSVTSCQMNLILSTNNNSTTWHMVQGYVDGPAASGIPAGASVRATCNLPTSELTNQASGTTASGVVGVKLINDWYSFKAGTATTVGFQATWN